MSADKQPPGNDITTMSKCGHSGFEHENGDNDHICRSCNTCWSFEQVGSAPTDHRQSSDGSDEQRLAQLFADANEKIDKLESDLLNSKIEIVQDLAQKIEKEGLIPIERIANEIVHQLKGRISPTHIRENLGNKYKDSRQSKNAKAKKRNQKVATVALPTKQLPKQQPSDGSDRTQQITVGVDGLETTDSGSEDPSMHPPSDDLENLPIDPPANQESSIESPEDSAGESSQPRQQQHIQPIISTQQQSQSSQQIRVLIDWDELQDKMADVHHKDIKSFWLCGRIENGTKKLLDMVLEREQHQMVVA